MMRVLVAVTSEADDAVDVVAAVKHFPWPAGVLFRVITVARPVHPSAPELMISAANVPDVQQGVDLRAKNIAASAAALLRDAGMNADSVSAEGDPARAIVNEAEQWRADLVVVGSSGRSRIERWILGSVSHGVVTKAPASVLVIKGASARLELGSEE